MKGRKLGALLALAALVVVIGSAWWLSLKRMPPPRSDASTPGEASASGSRPSFRTGKAQLPSRPAVDHFQPVVAKIELALVTPIDFFGKVVDQNGNPISDAEVAFGAADKFEQSGSNYSARSDKNGFFSITGIHGAALRVSVEKDGYYRIHNASNQSFAYGISPDSVRQAPPEKDKPAIFVLRKMGVAEPLLRIDSVSYGISRNGVPVEVDLTTGQVARQGHLRVEAWTEDLAVDAKGRYSWHCRVSVPNGTLAERRGPFDFEAPTDGYKAFDEIVMPQTAERWQPSAQREYFLKLADGRFARIQFQMIAQGHHFFVLESYLNPTAGSRNLEFDPKKSK